MQKYYQKGDVTIYQGSCLDFKREPVDLVIADPPYGCSKAEWDKVFPTPWYSSLKTLLKCPIYILTGGVGLKDTIPLVGDDFVDVISFRIMNGGSRSAIGFSNWIACVVANGKPRQGWNATSITLRRLSGYIKHPTTKPIALMESLINRVSEPGQLILDPFMGGGSTGVACLALGRKFIGVEIEEQYCEIAVQRIEKVQSYKHAESAYASRLTSDLSRKLRISTPSPKRKPT